MGDHNEVLDFEGKSMFCFQPPVFESEVAQRLSTPGVAVGESGRFERTPDSL